MGRFSKLRSVAVIVVAVILGPSYFVQCIHVWKGWVSSYDAFLYPAIGVAAYALLWVLLLAMRGTRVGMWENFQHELTHLVASLLCLARVTGFKAAAEDEETSTIGWVRGSRLGGFRALFVSLAPYWLPIYAIATLLILTITIPEVRAAVGVIFGITVTSHLLSLVRSVHVNQSDLTEFWFPLSVLIVLYANVLTITFILEVFVHRWEGGWYFVKQGFLGVFADDYWVPLHHVSDLVRHAIGLIRR